MLKPIILTIFAFFGITSISNAQSRLAQEVGIIFGPVTFQSDFGERNNFDTNIGNTGFGIGVVHFINFSSNSNTESFFNEHFKVRSELSFSKTTLKNYGEWVDKKPATLTTPATNESKEAIFLLWLKVLVLPWCLNISFCF